jgi:uncharacterized membrane protein YqhA
MIRSLLKIRYLAAVVALVFALHAVGFLVLGVLRAFDAYRLFLEPERAANDARPGIHIAESVDALLLSLVLLVLAVGTATLFLSTADPDGKGNVPEWMQVKSLTELKLLLWEAILATLVVAAAGGIIAALPHFEWKHLVLPIAILVLSVSYFLLKRTESKH